MREIVSFIFSKVSMFPETKSKETLALHLSRENKTYKFQEEDTSLNCFVLYCKEKYKKVELHDHGQIFIQK